MEEKWIQKAHIKKGALTDKAKRVGKSLSEFMKSPGKNVSAATRRQINLAKTLKGFHKHAK